MSSNTRRRLPASFWWANVTQFGGAMNDNLFKLFMIYALLDWQGTDRSAEILASVGVAFALPFLLIIPIAGSFADHFSKQWMFVRLKLAEILVMAFGITALTIGSIPMLYATMLLMSAQSAFFGPCKYGIVPEMVDAERLSKANGMLQLFTFLAIIAGTIIAPEVSLLLDGRYDLAAWICLLVAAIGFACSLKIAPTPAHANRSLNFNGISNLWHSAKEIRTDGFLALAIIAAAFFSLMGAFVQLNVLDYGSQHLVLSPEEATRLFLLTALGIGAGSVFAGWISGRSIEFGIVPIGAGLMFLGLVVLGTIPPGSIWVASACMLLLGLAAGMFIVPLEAFIQYRSPADKVGSIKAAGGFLSWIGILAASGLIYLNASVLDLDAQGGFLLVSILLLALTVFSLWILPDFFVKLVVMVITRTLHRMRVYGLDNLPHDKPALLLANHVGLMDALLVISCQQRRIRLILSRNAYTNANAFVKWIVRMGGTILVPDTNDSRGQSAALQKAQNAMEKGFHVCVFADGNSSATGSPAFLNPVAGQILAQTGHAVVPVHILTSPPPGPGQGGMNSRFPLLPKRRNPAVIHFGSAMPGNPSLIEVSKAVNALQPAK